MKYKIIAFESLESTNKWAKERLHSLQEGTVILADQQTEARGRSGRQWSSPEGGLWFSLILKPKLAAEEVSKLTLLAAAALNLALADLGISSLIKWPNDVIVGGKKVSGILTELQIDSQGNPNIVLGIGVNLNQRYDQIPNELRDKASSIYLESGKEIAREDLLSGILNYLSEFYVKFVEDADLDSVINICRQDSVVLGREVLIISGKETRKGKAIDIDPTGALLVDFPEGRERISYGEVSVRALKGYI